MRHITTCILFTLQLVVSVPRKNNKEGYQIHMCVDKIMKETKILRCPLNLKSHPDLSSVSRPEEIVVYICMSENTKNYKLCA